LITLRGVTHRLRLLTLLLGALLAVASCTSGGAAAPSDPTGACSSTTESGGLAGGGGECVADSAAAAPPPSTTPPPSTPGAPSEVEGDCPYLSRDDASDFEGNKVGRTTVVTTTPPGCNFYFAYGDGHMTLQISTQTFPDPIDAYNAMVTTANAAASADPVAGIADGAVLYQVGFYDLDADQDWACAFVKGTVLVVVNTSQKSPSYNARHIAETIAPLF
jgi:hypothetical protein